MDTELLKLCRSNNWKVYEMGLGIKTDINPSAENIAGELFTVFRKFFTPSEHGIQIEKIRLYETPNCWVESDSFIPYSKECNVFLQTWRNMKGNMSYDIREE
jgi:6-pyruvoyltetrahydropterin/6-carboxytetrahydropterin synthase